MNHKVCTMFCLFSSTPRHYFEIHSCCCLYQLLLPFPYWSASHFMATHHLLTHPDGSVFIKREPQRPDSYLDCLC